MCEIHNGSWLSICGLQGSTAYREHCWEISIPILASFKSIRHFIQRAPTYGCCCILVTPDIWINGFNINSFIDTILTTSFLSSVWAWVVTCEYYPCVYSSLVHQMPCLIAANGLIRLVIYVNHLEKYANVRIPCCVDLFLLFLQLRTNGGVPMELCCQQRLVEVKSLSKAATLFGWFLQLRCKVESIIMLFVLILETQNVFFISSLLILLYETCFNTSFFIKKY